MMAPQPAKFYTGPSGFRVGASVRVRICPERGLLAPWVDWQPGMDELYWYVPSQHCDPLRGMEETCRWQCTQPRQNTHDSFDKSKYYKPNRFFEDTGRARGMDASRHRDRSLQRFCDVLWRKPSAPAMASSFTPRDVHRLLERIGLDLPYRTGGLAAIAKAVGLTKRQREAFVLWPHHNQEEIATKLGITQAAVSQRLANASTRCRDWAGRTQNLIQLPLSSNRDARNRTAKRCLHSEDLQNSLEVSR